VKRLLALLLVALMVWQPVIAQKNVATKNWVISPSGDGLLYSLYPSGNKPSGFLTTPTLIATDIVSGSTTGGENNKGAYLRLYGYSFGAKSAIGTAPGARAFICGHEVDNYRALVNSPVYPALQVQTLIVQVGSLAGATGSCDVKLTVNGVDTNTLTGGFYVQPGRFWFVSLSGSDSTGVVDDITHPFRNLQAWGGGSQTNFTGIWATTTAHGDAGLRAGDTFVIRGGAWSDQNGFETHWARFSQQTGTVPNGSSSNGYIHFTSYPGAIGGNAPEDVHYTASNTGYGGIHGVGSANSDLGYGRYWSVSGLHIDGSALSLDGPINMQASAQTVKHDIRIVGNELGPWPTTLTAPNDAKSAGIAGDTYGGELLFNYIHDIDGDHTAQQNHGLYLDGAQHSARDVTIAYNWVKNATGGSCMQTHNQTAPDNIQNISVHHNVLDNCVKYGFNIDVAQSVNLYDNLIINSGVASIAWDTPAATPAIYITHNTARQSGGVGSNWGMIYNKGGASSTGFVRIQHNVLVMATGRGSTAWPYLSYNGSSNVTTQRNLFFDEAGVQNTVPSADATGIYGDPLFSNVTGKDFTVATSSPALAACTDAELLAVDVDLYGVARPVTGTGAPGGTKNDIGIGQGVGK
jgi:hypothetical protein